MTYKDKASYDSTPPCTTYCAHYMSMYSLQNVSLCSLENITYEVAMISRLLKDIGRFCRIQFFLKVFFAKETYVFREITNRSHLVCNYGVATISRIDKLQVSFAEYRLVYRALFQKDL